MELVGRIFEIGFTVVMAVILLFAIGGTAVEIFSDFEHEAKEKLRKKPAANPKLHALGMLALGLLMWAAVAVIFIGGCSGRSPYLY